VIFLEKFFKMRNRILLLLIFFCFFDSLKAQTNMATTEEIEEARDSGIFTSTEIRASFKGGDKVFMNYLSFNLNKNIPKVNGAPAGTYIVVIRFIVHKSGRISGVVAETKKGYGMEEEAMRIINTGPKWLPAMQNGYYVTAYKRQPITFLVE
jgi:periplasmic protein TonB